MRPHDIPVLEARAGGITAHGKVACQKAACEGTACCISLAHGGSYFPLSHSFLRMYVHI